MVKVHIVGAGPGDVDLITVKGLRCIETADIILYDRLINKELLTYAKKGAKLIFFVASYLVDMHDSRANQSCTS